jgi:DNA-binding response OmpR family regulator
VAALEAGCDDFLVKPVEIERLMTALMRQLDGAGRAARTADDQGR